MNRKSKTFTMVELLVVISIVMVLISMLQPALKSMMTKAHRVTCQNNLKQIGTAYALYPEDNDGWLCRGGNMYWGYELKDYLNFSFPSEERYYRNFNAKNTLLECPNTDYGNEEQSPLYGGYGFNTGYMGAFEVNYRRANLRRQKMYTVSNPSETLVIGDAMNYFKNNPRYHLMYAPSSIPWHEKAGYGSFVYTRHEGGLNIMWADGHGSHRDWESFKLGRGTDLNYYYKISK